MPQAGAAAPLAGPDETIALPTSMVAALLLFLAALLLMARAGSLRNRSLAGLLALIAASDGVAGGLVHALPREWMLAVLRLAWVAGLSTAGAYLLLLSTFDTPLAAPLRTRWGRVATVLVLALPAAATAVDPGIFIAGVQPVPFLGMDAVQGPAGLPALRVESLLGLYGLAVAVSAYRRALTPGSRKWAGWAIAAFSVRDGSFLIVAALFSFGLHYPVREARDLVTFFTIPTFDLAFALILAYAVLQAQVFELARPVRRWAMAVVAAWAGATAALLAADTTLAWRGEGLAHATILLVLGAGAAAGLAALAWLALRQGRRGPENAARRRVLAYQYALEEAWTLGREDQDAKLLEGLWERLAAKGVPVQDPAPAPTGSLFARFRVEREVLHGPRGRVLAAEDRSSGKRVLLQVPASWAGTPKWRAHYLAMVATVSALRSPRVVRMEALTATEPPAVVTESPPGGTLAARLKRSGPLLLVDAAQLLNDCLDGLVALHGAGIAHGDLRPENVHFDAKGRAKLGGLDANVRRAEAPIPTPGRAASVPATPADPAQADLLAVGHVFCAALGLPPKREDAMARLPSPWNDFVGKALATDPAGRFPDAVAMRDAAQRANLSLLV